MPICIRCGIIHQLSPDMSTLIGWGILITNPRHPGYTILKLIESRNVSVFINANVIVDGAYAGLCPSCMLNKEVE